jgi:hypothetical protein
MIINDKNNVTKENINKIEMKKHKTILGFNLLPSSGAPFLA